jgi:hypothetical protein
VCRPQSSIRKVPVRKVPVRKVAGTLRVPSASFFTSYATEGWLTAHGVCLLYGEVFMTDPQSWGMPDRFDPNDAKVIRRPESDESGYWVGAPGVFFDESTSNYYLSYRIRRPRGLASDRGAEVHLAASADGIEFETIWSCTKEEVGTASIERNAVRRLDNGQYALYLSFVDPADGRWRIDVCTADTIDGFDVTQRTNVFTAADLSVEGVDVEGVKDPALCRIAGQWQMIVSYATAVESPSHDQLHGSLDAYNTGLIRSATGLAVSEDGLNWQWQGELFGPSESGWDSYCARIGTVFARMECGSGCTMGLRRSKKTTRSAWASRTAMTCGVFTALPNRGRGCTRHMAPALCGILMCWTFPNGAWSFLKWRSQMEVTTYEFSK